MKGQSATDEAGGPATRTLLCASSAQDPKIREVLGFGGPEARLEEKLMTVVSGPDLVNITFLNFMAVQDDTAKVSQKTMVGGTPCPPGPLSVLQHTPVG